MLLAHARDLHGMEAMERKDSRNAAMPFPEIQNCHPERGRMPESKDPEEDDGLMSLRSIFTTPVFV